jgi:hypothetical protein
MYIAARHVEIGSMTQSETTAEVAV